jgi:hypothetical protein
MKKDTSRTPVRIALFSFAVGFDTLPLAAGSLLHLWIFCIFMQKIPTNGLLWEFVRYKIHIREFYTVLCAKRNKLLVVQFTSGKRTEAFRLHRVKELTH